MSKNASIALFQLAMIFTMSAKASAGESIVTIVTPPAVAAPDERKVETVERDACCQELMNEGRLFKKRFPDVVLGAESISYSEKFGYVLRYEKMENFASGDASYSRVVIFMIDNKRFHTVIDYSI